MQSATANNSYIVNLIKIGVGMREIFMQTGSGRPKHGLASPVLRFGGGHGLVDPLLDPLVVADRYLQANTLSA